MVFEFGKQVLYKISELRKPEDPESEGKELILPCCDLLDEMAGA
jgi:hypothetical protein